MDFVSTTATTANLAPAAVQVNYDDDDILMDYEDEAPPAPAPVEVAMEIDGGQGASVVEAGTVVPEKVHLRGVDNMSTANVKAFATEHFPEAEARQVEWIDDTSCNLVYDTPELARRVLSALQLESTAAELPLLTLRAAKVTSTHPDSRLQLRIARPEDRKERGAREKSRYYLFHPEEDRVEQRERERREAPRRRRHEDDDRERGYQRRYYDSSEHDRRNGDRRGNDQYDIGFYDEEDPAAVVTTRGTSYSGSRSRERSYSPDRERRSRRRDRSPPVELFPDRRQDRRSDLLQQPKRKSSIELFPEKRTTLRDDRRLRSTRSLSPSDSPRQQQHHRKQTELFPSRPETGGLFSDRLSSSSVTTTSITINGNGTRKLEERIKMPPRGLEERINFEDAPLAGPGIKIKGRGAMTGADGFAEKLRAAKGVELLPELRARGKRARAEDTLFNY